MRWPHLGETQAHRPVRLINTFSKCLEKLYGKYIGEYMTGILMLRKIGHGFTKSAPRKLLGSSNEVTTGRGWRKMVVHCYLDFAKAFDLVNERLQICLRWAIQCTHMSFGIPNQQNY